MSDKAQGVTVEFVRTFVKISSIRRQCFTRGAPRDVRGGIVFLRAETGQGCVRVRGRNFSNVRMSLTPNKIRAVWGSYKVVVYYRSYQVVVYYRSYQVVVYYRSYQVVVFYRST